jgi:dCTP deaminase
MSRIDIIGQNGNNGDHYMEMTTGLLSSLELQYLVDQGVIEGVQSGAINAASIDLHLGGEFLHESDPGDHASGVVNLAKREKPAMYKETGYTHLLPGDFCLASTREIFHLPDDISGMFILKSSMARAGLEHSQAGWADAGWHGSALTLELSNLLRNHTLQLEEGMAIGQIILFRHSKVPKAFSYSTKGRYNNDKSVSQIKE